MPDPQRREVNTMQMSHQVNGTSTIAYRVAGAVVAIVGVGLLALEIRQVISLSGPAGFTARGSRALADAVAMAFWAAVILVSGCYIWRAGRRTGWRDRLGRVLLIAGYVVIGVAVSRTVHSAIPMFAARNVSDKAMLSVFLTFVAIGAVGAVIAEIGRRMAAEKFLMTVEANYSA
jgi:hypothetical protein